MNDFEAYISDPNNIITDIGELPRRALTLINDSIISEVTQFHQGIPGYRETPLVDLTELAQRFGVKSILVKDESSRFDLKAFKGLGASYAIARLISTYLGCKKNLSYAQLRQRKAEYSDLEFATTTDGNHGKAVAWSAQLFGCRSHIFMPKGTLACRKEAIQAFTEEVEITDFNYDKTVEL
ncbi:MAG: pyridoxal-phosphate dependent enzyme, partial [Kangiellaceae bacterium]|nr:pyridoxal-phosphate dependent enzyme [Kangiellaceae bacterium]